MIEALAVIQRLREAVLNGVAEFDREVEAVGICDRVTEGVAEELAEGVVKGVLDALSDGDT